MGWLFCLVVLNEFTCWLLMYVSFGFVLRGFVFVCLFWFVCGCGYVCYILWLFLVVLGIDACCLVLLWLLVWIYNLVVWIAGFYYVVLCCCLLRGCWFDFRLIYMRWLVNMFVCICRFTVDLVFLFACSRGTPLFWFLILCLDFGVILCLMLGFVCFCFLVVLGIALIGCCDFCYGWIWC